MKNEENKEVPSLIVIISSVIEKSWQFFASPKLAVFLFMSIVALCLLASILPQEGTATVKEWGELSEFGEFYNKTGLNNIYRSMWMFIPMLFLGINTFICLVDKFSKEKKWFAAIHLGFLFAIFGGCISWLTYIDYNFYVKIGETVTKVKIETPDGHTDVYSELPVHVKLESFTKEFYPTEKVVTMYRQLHAHDNREHPVFDLPSTSGVYPALKLVKDIPEYENTAYKVEVKEKMDNAIIETQWLNLPKKSDKLAVLVKVNEKDQPEKILPLTVYDALFYPDKKAYITLRSVTKNDDLEKAFKPLKEGISLHAVYRDGRIIELPTKVGEEFEIEKKKFKVKNYFEKFSVDKGKLTSDANVLNPALQLEEITSEKNDRKKKQDISMESSHLLYADYELFHSSYQPFRNPVLVLKHTGYKSEYDKEIRFVVTPGDEVYSGVLEKGKLTSDIKKVKPKTQIDNVRKQLDVSFLHLMRNFFVTESRVIPDTNTQEDNQAVFVSISMKDKLEELGLPYRTASGWSTSKPSKELIRVQDYGDFYWHEMRPPVNIMSPDRLVSAGFRTFRKDKAHKVKLKIRDKNADSEWSDIECGIGQPAVFSGFLGFNTYYIYPMNISNDQQEGYVENPKGSFFYIVQDNGWPFVIVGMILMSLGFCVRLSESFRKRSSEK